MHFFAKQTISCCFALTKGSGILAPDNHKE